MWLCSQQTEATRLFQLVDLRCCDIPAAHLLLETPIQVMPPTTCFWNMSRKPKTHGITHGFTKFYRRQLASSTDDVDDVNQRHVKSLVSKSQVLQWIITIMNIIPLWYILSIYTEYQNTTNKTPAIWNTSPLFFPLFTKLIDSTPAGFAPWHRESSRAKARSCDPHRGFIDWWVSVSWVPPGAGISKTSGKLGDVNGETKFHPVDGCFGNVP